MRRLIALSLLLVAAAKPALPHVRLDTSAGPIVVELDTRRAPITANNFLAYVDEHRFDNTSFYRAARAKADPRRGFVQGGVNHVFGHSRFPIPHEPTSKTGLHHLDGTLSMAMFKPGLRRVTGRSWSAPPRRWTRTVPTPAMPRSGM